MKSVKESVVSLSEPELRSRSPPVSMSVSRRSRNTTRILEVFLLLLIVHSCFASTASAKEVLHQDRVARAKVNGHANDKGHRTKTNTNSKATDKDTNTHASTARNFLQRCEDLHKKANVCPAIPRGWIHMDGPYRRRGKISGGGQDEETPGYGAHDMVVNLGVIHKASAVAPVPEPEPLPGRGIVGGVSASKSLQPAPANYDYNYNNRQNNYNYDDATLTTLGHGGNVNDYGGYKNEYNYYDYDYDQDHQQDQNVVYQQPQRAGYGQHLGSMKLGALEAGARPRHQPGARQSVERNANGFPDARRNLRRRRPRPAFRQRRPFNNKQRQPPINVDIGREVLPQAQQWPGNSRPGRRGLRRRPLPVIDNSGGVGVSVPLPFQPPPQFQPQPELLPQPMPQRQSRRRQPYAYRKQQFE